MPLHRKLRFERQRPHTAQDLSRFGGLPPGLRDGRWPLFYNPELDEALPGTHVLTIETRSLELEVAPEVVALSLFISDPEMPWFFDDPTADLQVIALTADDLNAGVSAPQDVSSLPTGLLHFDPPAGGASFVGGIAKYLQQDRPTSPEPGFVLQCRANELNINLGDSGLLFMFTSWAMWESH